MRDPHVSHLRYSIRHGDDTSFVDPPGVHATTNSFEALLEEGILTVTMLEHFSSVDHARAVVDPYLRAWELQDELQGARTGIEFVYESAEVIDRDPPPPGERKVVKLEAGLYSVSGMSATLHVGRRSYPPPPAQFAVTPDVETMWFRYRGYLSGREPLLAMAYFCLSVLEASAGGRDRAAAIYSVDREVLRKVGEFSSTRGDASSARKASGVGTPLLDREAGWLDAAVRLLIARAAEVAGGRSAARITMKDLPYL
jgi:hypothetical protein